MRSSSSLSSSSGRTTPSLKTSMTDLKRPPSRSHRPQSPKHPTPRSRPGSSLGSRPATPSFRPEPYTGTIKVSIRPNPLTNTSKHQHWAIDQYSNTITNVLDSSSYSFDNIFPPTTTISNREVYDKSCAHLVQNFLNEGYNCTLFAYGMTGSGKTYSMRGEDNDPGFVRLAIDEIFDKVEAEQFSKKHTLSVSYLEIYNEKIVDLLATAPSAGDLKIRDDTEYGTKIVGINSPTINSKAHLLQLIKTGDTKRKTSATDYNARSSRSHAILQLKLHTVDSLANTEARCTLSLCDLAGSERATSSLERRKEGAFINKSLLALSTVINKLSLLSTSTMGSGMEHIPYRDSKLTRLLQPALSGSSLISILCTVHLGASQPALDQQVVTETYNTLRFAARAKDIVMAVNTNKKHSLSNPDTQRLIQELESTIASQSQEIKKLKSSSSTSPLTGMSFAGPGPNDAVVAELRAEIRVQNEKIEHLHRLNDLQKTETILLRNDALNDILGIESEKGVSQMMMSNLEEFYKRVNYEIEEYKRYIAHLEHQLKLAQQKNLSSSKPGRGLADNHLEDLLKEQEEEIWQLKENLKDKDQIIHSLTKTSKLRRLVDSNYTSEGDVVRPMGAPSNKENRERIF